MFQRSSVAVVIGFLVVCMATGCDKSESTTTPVVKPKLDAQWWGSYTRAHTKTVIGDTAMIKLTLTAGGIASEGGGSAESGNGFSASFDTLQCESNSCDWTAKHSFVSDGSSHDEGVRVEHTLSGTLARIDDGSIILTANGCKDYDAVYCTNLSGTFQPSAAASSKKAVLTEPKLQFPKAMRGDYSLTEGGGYCGLSGMKLLVTKTKMVFTKSKSMYNGAFHLRTVEEDDPLVNVTGDEGDKDKSKKHVVSIRMHGDSVLEIVSYEDGYPVKGGHCRIGKFTRIASNIKPRLDHVENDATKSVSTDVKLDAKQIKHVDGILVLLTSLKRPLFAGGHPLQFTVACPAAMRHAKELENVEHGHVQALIKDVRLMCNYSLPMAGLKAWMTNFKTENKQCRWIKKFIEKLQKTHVNDPTVKEATTLFSKHCSSSH